jgi:transposase
MSGKKGMQRYPVEIKLEAVRMFMEEGKTRAEITKLLGIRDEGRVKMWVRQFRRDRTGFSKPIGRPRKQAEKVESPQEELKRLRMENDLLKKFHAELRKMELAQRNIGSSITKKKPTK